MMVYRIRKYGGPIIIIGHDGKDVAPAVRELCTACHKTGKKTARFYRDVKNRKGRNPLTGLLQGISLPDKSWQPNTNDLALWSWQEGEDDGVDAKKSYHEMAFWTVINCEEQELSHREMAKFVPCSKSQIGRI